MLCVVGTMVVYLFFLDCVPLTGGKRLGWLSGSSLREPDEVDRVSVKELGRSERIWNEDTDSPALQSIESVVSRAVRASGLDDIVWEVGVTHEPVM